MANYFSQYQGGGPAALPPGYMQAATAPGRYLAEGFASVGEDIAAGLEKYRKNKSELARAQADFENLAERVDPEIMMYSVDSKRLNKIQEGKGSVEDFLSATNSINAKIEEIEKFKEQDFKERERQDTKAFREATLQQGQSKIDLTRQQVANATAKAASELAEKDERTMQDKVFLEAQAEFANVSPVRFEEFVDTSVPQSSFGPPFMSSRKIERSPEEMRAEALEIFAANAPNMGVENAVRFKEAIDKEFPTPLTSNLKVTQLPTGEKFIENVKGGGFQEIGEKTTIPATVQSTKMQIDDKKLERQQESVKYIDTKIEKRKAQLIELKKDDGAEFNAKLITQLEKEIEKLESEKTTAKNKFIYSIDGGMEPR